jgi:cobalt-zinc-cadmium efflux system outer membrane protein
MRCRVIGFLLGIASLASAGTASAQELKSELDQLIHEALDRNPDVQAALARWDLARQRPEREGSLPDPSLSAQIIRFRGRDAGIRSEGETWYMLRQDVPFPGKLGLRSRMARREAEMAGEDYQAARLDLVEAVRLAYYHLLHAEALNGIGLVNLELIERTAAIAGARYEVGRAPQQELLLARVERARIGNELADLQRMRSAAVVELEALLGAPLPAGFAADHASRTPAVRLESDSLVAEALARRPELRAARLETARDTVALRLARKAYLPDLMLGLEYWVGEGENPSPLPDERYVLDVGFTVPWIWKGKHDAAVREARAALRESGYTVEAVANRVRREVETAVAEMQAAGERLQNFETTILPEAGLNLESATEAYQTDRVDFLSVLDAQRSLAELRIAYHTARVELLIASARLERAVGREPPAEGSPTAGVGVVVGEVTP